MSYKKYNEGYRQGKEDAERKAQAEAQASVLQMQRDELRASDPHTFVIENLLDIVGGGKFNMTPHDARVNAAKLLLEHYRAEA